jgi:3-methyladenine DNA glycosylase AlkD
MSTNTMLEDVMRELAALEEPTIREANERRGDDHGVNLTHLRALAKRLKTQHELDEARPGR